MTAAPSSFYALNTPAFQSPYYGVYAADPLTDPLGRALQMGAIYYNSTSLQLKTYNGTAWVAGANTPPGGTSGQVQWNNAGAFAGLTVSGDGTLVTSSGVLTIAAGAVTLAKMANLAANSVIGNNTGSPATPIALTQTQLTAMVNTFTSSLSGAVASSGGGTTNFLRADGTWAAPGGGGTPGGASLTVQYNNAGAFGGMSGTSWDDTNRALTLTGATVTTSNPILNLSQTWNASGVAFNGILVTVTNTASAAGSRMLNLTNGSSYFRICKDGGIDAFDAAITGAINIGVNNATIDFGAANGGTPSGQISAAGFAIGNAENYSWSSTASAAGGVDVSLFRDAAGILAQRSSTSAQTLRVYNTFTDASNYERGMIDWTTTANQLTLGAQAAGTGTLRNIWFAGAKYFFSANSSVARGACQADATSGLDGFSVRNTGSFWWANDTNNNSSSSADTGLYRSTTGVIVLTSVLNSAIFGTSANAWMQWAGQTRVTADFTVTSSTTLTNVTGLTVNVQAGRTYQFETELYVTDAAAGGVQAAIAGTATATAIQYTGYTIADNAIKAKTNATALATAVGSTTTTETAGIIVRITGTITVNAAGTLTVQMAQNTSNATPTTAKRGSWFIVQDMP